MSETENLDSKLKERLPTELLHLLEAIGAMAAYQGRHIYLVGGAVRDLLLGRETLDLDLVEISPKADPPVCRAIDYQKFLYQQKKKQKEMKSKATKIVVKEIRFGPNTDDHDYSFKLKHAHKFLEDGAKLKAFVFFKGRSILYKEKGEILLLRLAQDLEEVGKVEQLPKLEGKRMTMFLTPKVKKK